MRLDPGLMLLINQASTGEQMRAGAVTPSALAPASAAHAVVTAAAASDEQTKPSAQPVISITSPAAGAVVAAAVKPFSTAIIALGVVASLATIFGTIIVYRSFQEDRSHRQEVRDAMRRRP